MNHPMMNPLWGYLAGAITLLLMVIFIGIWIWAWRKRHQATFQRLSELPMEDSPERPAPDTARAASNNSKGGQP